MGLIGVIILVIAGCLNSLTIYLYLFALENEETSIVVPFFQTIPIFGFILGSFLLDEILSVNQILGALIIILGAFILSLEINELNKIGFKRKVALLMQGTHSNIWYIRF